MTPLLCAVEKEDESIVKLLLEKGAMPDYEDGQGWSPLSVAERKRNVLITNLLEMYRKS
ncbi:hypothetical protein F5883DRAFT_586737 [Diaporthe sp. PMI_573]|nr:hypothetical protein F5883DRAFT_586737 [Diaporthaceae sp. PMI_573]